MRSMTGFGRGTGEFQGESFRVEARSLNHRFLECIIRIPKQYNHLEDRVRKLVQEYVERGRVEVNITALADRGAFRKVRADKELGVAYYRALQELGQNLELSTAVDVATIAAYPDVLQVEEEEIDPEVSWQALGSALTQAVTGLVSMRQAEGDKLQTDIIHRIGRIEQVISNIKERAPQVVDEYRIGLKQRISNLVGEGEVEESRLLTEVAFFAEKANITEEVVRLFSHVELFRDTVAQDSAQGRKFDFILQEMHREINTIGSKAQDIDISRAVVAVKSELEKIREQVQNVE